MLHLQTQDLSIAQHCHPPNLFLLNSPVRIISVYSSDTSYHPIAAFIHQASVEVIMLWHPGAL